MMVELPLLLPVVVLVLAMGFRASREFRGAARVRRAARVAVEKKTDGKDVMRAELGRLPEEFVVLHDVTLPSEHGDVRIEHIVLADSVAWVVEPKDWSARVNGGRHREEWRWEHDGKEGTIRNPLFQAGRLARAVRRIIRVPVKKVVVFVGPGWVDVKAPGVWFSAASAVRYIEGRLPRVMTRDGAGAAAHAAAIRDAALPGSGGTDRARRRRARGTAPDTAPEPP